MSVNKVVQTLEESRDHLFALRTQVAEAIQKVDELIGLVREQGAPEDSLRHWQDEFDKIVKRVHGEV